MPAGKAFWAYEGNPWNYVKVIEHSDLVISDSNIQIQFEALKIYSLNER